MQSRADRDWTFDGSNVQCLREADQGGRAALHHFWWHRLWIEISQPSGCDANRVHCDIDLLRNHAGVVSDRSCQ